MERTNPKPESSSLTWIKPGSTKKVIIIIIVKTPTPPILKEYLHLVPWRPPTSYKLSSRGVHLAPSHTLQHSWDIHNVLFTISAQFWDWLIIILIVLYLESLLKIQYEWIRRSKNILSNHSSFFWIWEQWSVTVAYKRWCHLLWHSFHREEEVYVPSPWIGASPETTVTNGTQQK